jgi:hypothetical protein
LLPVSVALGAKFDVWAVADNGIDGPVASKSPTPLAVIGGESGPLSSGAGASLSVQQQFGVRTTLAKGLGPSNTTIHVNSAEGFPESSVFWISVGDSEGFRQETMKVTSGAGTTTWTVERTSSNQETFFPGTTVRMDPVYLYVNSELGGDANKLNAFVRSINGGNTLPRAREEFLKIEASDIELRAADAYARWTGGDAGRLPIVLASLVTDAFQGNVEFHQWIPSKPTIVLMHGVMSFPGNVHELGKKFQSALGSGVNVVSLFWGFTSLFNGFDRDIADLLADAGITEGEAFNLRGALQLNKLLRFLDRAYDIVGKDSAEEVSIIAHSQGTVVTTGALAFDATEVNPFFTFDYKQALFIGANLNYRGQDLLALPGARRKIINLSSVNDVIVSLPPGSDKGLGNEGLIAGVTLPGFFSRPAPQIDNGISALRNLKIVHSNLFVGEGEIGWWDRLERMETEGRRFVTQGVTAEGGFAGIIEDLWQQGDSFESAPSILQANRDRPLGFPRIPGSSLISPVFPVFDFVRFVLPGGGAGAKDNTIGAGSSGPPALTINQGDYFVAEAVGAIDADGYIFRADFYRDANGNGLPDESDQEFLGSDFHAGNGWKRAIYTADWALGTHEIIAQVFDNGGNASNIKVATVQVVDPTLPPGPLPVTFDNSQRPQFNILPHRNGDVSYEPSLLNLVPGSMDVWQITPQTGGGFKFETTGDTDTVLGLYDWANGDLLAVDEDNGAGNNAEVTHTLVAGHTYVLIIVSQRGDSGAYGLDVTGANQTITASPLFQAPLYEATVSESISQPFELDYFLMDVPATTTSLNVVLDVDPSLDGWVRVENAAHETLATAFLAGAGDDENLMAIDVNPGEDVFITVAGLEGTTGSYTLNIDFGPDEPGLPATMDPPPTEGIRIIPNPDGTFMLADQSITTAGQFRSYQFFAHELVGGQYTFETFGDLDTQIGVYLRHSQSNSTLVASNDDSGGGENARLTVNLNPGDDYIIIVRGEGNDTGDFDLSVSGPSLTPLNLVIGGLAFEYTANYQSLGHDDRFYHYQVVAPYTATSLTTYAEINPISPDLDISLRVSDAAGNVLATADVNSPGAIETISNLSIVGGETYYVTIYSEDYTIGSTRIHLNFDPDFSVGSGTQFPVNTVFEGEQDFPDVARNSNGQSVAVWWDHQLERISGQRFDANAQPVGVEFQVNSTPILFTLLPAVGIAANGNFIVVFGEPGSGGQPKFRIFNASGTPLTGDLDVGFSIVGTVDVAVEPNGRFFIVGASGAGIDGGQLLGRLFDANGTPLTTALILDDTNDDNSDASVAADGNGNFIIAWESNFDGPGQTDSNTVYAIRIDSSGNILPSGRNTYVHGTVSGRRFDDANGNGLQDAGEAGIGGVTVLLDGNDDGFQDAGEQTQITDGEGNYTFTAVAEGIYSVVQLAGPPSGPADFGDNFSRPDDTDLGADWAEITGDLRIENGEVRGENDFAESAAIYGPPAGLDQYVEFDLDYRTTGTSRIAGVYLAYDDPDNYLQVTFQDYSEQLGFRNLVFTHRAFGFSRWPRMSGGDFFELVPVFTTAHIFAGYESNSQTITIGIDANFDGVYETIVTRGGIPSDGLGTNVGIASWNDVAIDNFTVNPNAQVVPPQVVSPTEAFLVAPGLNRNQFNPVVASHGDGTFAIALEGWMPDDTDANIYVQRFGNDAFPDGDLLLANSEVAGNQLEPSIALLSQGKFLVAWEGNDANGRGIRAQQIGVNMERIGPEFTLNQTETGTQQNVALASDGDERIIAVWESLDAHLVGIYGLDFTLAEVQEPEITSTDTSGPSGDRFVDFGSQLAEVGGGTVGSFAPDTLTITNDGNAPLTIDSVELYGADAVMFELSDYSSFVLNPGENHNIEVSFIGTELGEHYAALRLNHNDNSDILSGDFDADPYWISLLAKIVSPLVGDYNRDGYVDEDDFLFWRSGFGQSGADLPADGSGNGIVDAADYTVWRDNSGATLFPPQPPELLGDYNQNGIVDAADYTVWRDTLGDEVVRYSGADGSGNGMIDEADFVVWRSNFGDTWQPGSGAFEGRSSEQASARAVSAISQSSLEETVTTVETAIPSTAPAPVSVTMVTGSTAIGEDSAAEFAVTDNFDSLDLNTVAEAEIESTVRSSFVAVRVIDEAVLARILSDVLPSRVRHGSMASDRTAVSMQRLTELSRWPQEELLGASLRDLGSLGRDAATPPMNRLQVDQDDEETRCSFDAVDRVYENMGMSRWKGRLKSPIV